MATDNTHYNYALGRRKSATARVRVQSGTGAFTINGSDLNDYFDHSKPLVREVMRPFIVVDLPANKYDVSVVVSGGGTHGQTEAIRLGIAKALVVMNQDLKSTLRRAELLGRDPREKERKKAGLRSARKQRQFTKR